MAISGITRVSDTLRMNMLLNNVRQSNLQLSEVQQQLATGNRLLAPSSDPAAANSAMSIQRVLEQQAQILDNIRNATAVYNTTDSTLGDAGDLLQQAYTTAQANLGTATTPDQQKEAAQLVDSVMQQLLTLANTSQGGVFLFAGTANTSAPFVSEAGGVRYVGADQATQAMLGGQNPMPVGLTGDEVFGAMSSEVKGYKDLTPALSLDTRLDDLGGAGGAGVNRSSIIISDGTNQITVDLSSADRIGDVIDLINQAGGGTIQASLGPAQNLRITSSAPGANLQVTEVGGGRTAHDLGIYRPTGQGASLSGDNVRPVLTATTPLADLAGGAGLDLSSGLTITNGGHSATLSFEGDTNVGDLLSRINSAGLGVVARINEAGTGIDIVNTLSGSAMRIGENGGTTADDLGVRSFRLDTKLADLNDGYGVRASDGDDFTVTARDGSTFNVDVSSAQTVGDVVDLINAAATAAGAAVTAGLTTAGNGIELTDTTGGTGDLSVAAVNGSQAAGDLGLLKNVSGPTLTGDDVNGVQPGGVFAHLAELRDALASGDSWKITRAAQRVQDDQQRLVNLRAQVGGREQDLAARQQRGEDQDTANQALLSQLKDTDFAEAVTRFQALQTALQGNLMSGAQMLSLSLLDFLR